MKDFGAECRDVRFREVGVRRISIILYISLVIADRSAARLLTAHPPRTSATDTYVTLWASQTAHFSRPK